MKIRELKNLLNNYEDDFDIFIRNGNGALETNDLRIVKIYGNKTNAYLIDSKY